MMHYRCWSKVAKKCKCLQINGEISPIFEGTLIGVPHLLMEQCATEKKKKTSGSFGYGGYIT